MGQPLEIESQLLVKWKLVLYVLAFFGGRFFAIAGAEFLDGGAKLLPRPFAAGGQP